MADRRSEQSKEFRDLGFGARVATMSARRLLNQDGSFNTKRKGLGFIGYLGLYNRLLTMSWPAFVVLLAAYYLFTNACFALGYSMIGHGALMGEAASSFPDQFAQSFFFSVQTLSTVGYGHVVPVGYYANALMTLESMVGLFGLALATGLVFARFSRPTAKIVFSRNAVIAPYRGITGFEFRIANLRKSEIVDLEARVMVSLMENEGGRRVPIVSSRAESSRKKRAPVDLLTALTRTWPACALSDGGAFAPLRSTEELPHRWVAAIARRSLSS